MSVYEAITYLVVGAITLRLSYYALTKREWLEAYRNIKWGFMVLNFLFFLGVIAIAVALYMMNEKVFGFSLWTLFQSKDSGEATGINIVGLGAQIKYFGVVYCLIALLALPYMARIEEEMFREGTSNWAHGIRRSIRFGFVHMLVGVPVAGAIVLSFLGLFLTYCYFRGGVKLSTQVHFQNNLIVFLVLLIFAIVNVF